MELGRNWQDACITAIGTPRESELVPESLWNIKVDTG